MMTPSSPEKGTLRYPSLGPPQQALLLCWCRVADTRSSYAKTHMTREREAAAAPMKKRAVSRP